jgi:hypothetical protein
MANLTKAAIWYAKHGWFVVPLHTPLFNDAGECVGCSCEDWKRANMRDKYGNLQSDYSCPTPGKHPRHNAWEERASNDVDQVARWWAAWPDANIGIAAGKSGLVVLDADTYKDGGGQWAHEWGETITSLTGGGGEHLVYAHPSGDPLGGSSRGLPKWVDVRAHGGQFVAPPSVHPSGNRYQWEEGYGPHEMEPAILPEPIALLLAEAKAAPPVEFGAPASVDLEAYADKLPGLVMALLRGDRSSIDFWLVRAMVKAGMEPAEIKAVWDNFDPTGKYSDKGRSGDDYLARTIAGALEHMAQRQRPLPAIAKERTAA